MARRGARPALRLIWLLLSFVLAFGLVVGRLVHLQVVKAEPLELLGSKQRTDRIELPARRGGIYDRDGTPLAVSAEARALYANPRFIANPDLVAANIAPILDVDEEELAERLGRDSGFVYIARRVPVHLARKVLALELPGVGALKETRRAYPSDALAGQVLGFVNIDNEGLSGIESTFDELLSGEPGEQIVERDPQGRPIPQGQNQVRAPVRGRDVRLTIDRDIQFAAEQALAAGVRNTNARGGQAIVMDPRTGEVLAMANHPPLNPNDFGNAEPDARRNRVVTDVYEPGSVNKVVTAAAAIEAGLIDPGDVLVVPYRYRVAEKLFSDYAPHPTQRLTYAEALARSSNVGTIKVAERLGRKRLYQALRSFGFGERTGIGFPGESPGILSQPSKWYGTDMGTIPIGQGIAVTPLQVASVYATIANDGVRVPPTLVKEVNGRAPKDGRKPRRVISPYTAAQVRSMLVGVVEGGTGVRAQVPGYLVGGKTGTARIPSTTRRGYTTDIVTTFAGMAPADEPRLVVVVSLDNPRPRFSALTAAPVFKQILQFSLAHLGVRPTVPIDDRGSLLLRRAKALPQPSRAAAVATSPVARTGGEQDRRP